MINYNMIASILIEYNNIQTGWLNNKQHNHLGYFCPNIATNS